MTYKTICKSVLRRYLPAMLLIPMLAITALTTRANVISLNTTVFDTDYTMAGVGGMRNQGGGTIALSGVSGNVTTAYLYWHGPTNSTNPDVNANVLVNGVAVTWTNIGFSADNNWGFQNSQAYRADITGIVAATGNGDYILSGFGMAPESAANAANTNGASLVVFFNDGVPTNNRDIVIFDGNDSNQANTFDPAGWNVTLSGINYSAGNAFIELHVSDGQTFQDDGIRINGSVFLAPGPNFNGNTVPSANNGPSNNGSLWDIRRFDVSSFLVPGPNTLNLVTFLPTSGDYDLLSLIVAVVDLPAGAAPGNRIELTPSELTSCINTQQELTATVQTINGDPIEGQPVSFNVNSGPNSGLSSVVISGNVGSATFSYTSAIAGLDSIEACITNADGSTSCTTALVTWTECAGSPPDVSQAYPSVACLWSPNHRFVPISILGITDPDGDDIVITITGVTSDEPTATAPGAGGGIHSPDASGVGTNTAHLRAERSGRGDGRVYVIHFVATDSSGLESAGSVEVRVPHDRRSRMCHAIDSGQNYDAT